eukprot:COSAG06_NODE_3137_length_5802_cov_19.787480_4_plen_452_part_00
MIFDGTDIAGFVAAIGSGLPGMYVLRLLGDAQSLVVAGLSTIFPYQDVRIVSAATGDSSVEFETSLEVKGAGQLTISGTLAGLAFSSGASLNIISDGAVSLPSALTTLTFGGALTLGQGVALTIPDSALTTLDFSGAVTLSEGAALTIPDSAVLTTLTFGGTLTLGEGVALTIPDTTAVLTTLDFGGGVTLREGAALTIPDSALTTLTFGGTLRLGEGVALTIPGANDMALAVQNLAVAATAQLTVSGAIVLANPYLIIAGASPSLNLGSVTFQNGVSVTLPDGTTPTVDGALPGTVALELGGSTLVTVSRTADENPVYSPASWVWPHSYQGGALYLLPLMSNPGGDDQDGTNWYIDACTAAGLHAVGCEQSYYDYTASQYTQGGRPGGVNGWGDMGCDIHYWITTNTGWSNFVNLESSYLQSSYLHGDSTGRSNGYGGTNPVHPVCATPP